MDRTFLDEDIEMKPMVIKPETVMDPLQIQKIMDERVYQEWLRQEYSEDIPANDRPPMMTFTNQEKALVRKLVRELPPIERSVIYLRFWENCLLEEIAQCFGMRVAKVEQILERALKRLRVLFTQTHVKEATLEPALA